MFFKKKEKPGLQEEVVLWKADQGGPKAVDPRGKSVRLYNIPVSPDALAGHGKIYTVQSSTKGDGSYRGQSEVLRVKRAQTLHIYCMFEP